KDLLNFKKINSEPNSIRYTYYTMLLTNIQSITKDIQIAVGRDKTLYISKNSGVDWDLISNFYSNGILYWYNATHGFACADDGRIYRTKDGGTTWLPQYYTDATIRGDNGIRTIRQLVFEPSGKGFAIGSNTYSESVSILATQDFGDTYTPIKIPELWGGLVGNYMVYKILGKYIVYKPEPYGMKQGLYRTQIIVLDTNFSVLSQSLHGLDSVLLKRIYPKNDTSFYALAEVDYPDKRYFLYEGDSTGTHWKHVRTFILPKSDDYRDLFMFDDYIMVITSIRDSTSPQWSTYYIRNIDINTGEVSKEYFSENRSYMNRLIKFRDTWILGGWQGMFFTKTPENPASWVKDSVVYTSKQPIMFPLWCNDALAYFYYSQSDGKKSILKINYTETSTNVEESSIEELSAYNVYVGSVAPNPATEHANFHLYIDATAKNVGLKIYDIHGNEVADCTGSVQHISTINGWCDVSVSISNIPTGIYYARIQSDKYKHAVPFVVLR
ncbi:MAG: T9SS type A sorting domain-containing protein, partial [Candidatus Kapabacteria bacterium]|nr:T9SS type A sorting domain-containing protein [Candidatus Kapabacteria bacterium]